MSSKPDWSRKYFVLKGSDMFYYKSREDFEADPSKSIKNRPIGVSKYVLKQISEKENPPFEFELKVFFRALLYFYFCRLFSCFLAGV